MLKQTTGWFRAKNLPETTYTFEDDGEQKIIPFPTSIEAMGREEQQITNMLVEIECDMAKLDRERVNLSERRFKLREAIAQWARDHGCKSEAT